MSYCRYCGRKLCILELPMKNGFLMTLQVNHIFVTKKENLLKTSGLEVCKSCGKPVFKMKGKTVDYTSLEIHQCKKQILLGMENIRIYKKENT